MEEVLPFDILIPFYKEVYDGHSNIIYFNIEIYKMGIKKWSIEKRFREFVQLQTQLTSSYGNLPMLPAKTVFRISDTPQVDERRQHLEKYLHTLVLRKDILSSDFLRRFLQIEHFAPEMLLKSPTLISEVVGFRFGIRDFYYQADKGLLFVAISDMSIFSRLDSYINNFKFPWGSKKENPRITPVGAIECYRQIGSLEMFNFEKVWSKTFPTQIIAIYWDQMSSLLAIGADDGNVFIFKVYEDQTFHEVRTILCHKRRVMGVYINNISEHVFSAGEDNLFRVHDTKTGHIVADISCGYTPLTALVADKENKRVLLSNSIGSIYIFDISPKVPQLIHIAQSHPNGLIRGLCFDNQRNYLITANYDDGVISLTDLQKPGKERYSMVISNLEGKPKARCCAWSTSRTELYTGTEDGIVTFWDAKKASPLYAIKAHASGITRLQWLEGHDILVTGGKDKKMAFYKLPLEWRDRKVETHLLRESLVRRKTEAMIQLRRTLSRMDFDSDEDDLNGWARDT